MKVSVWTVICTLLQGVRGEVQSIEVLLCCVCDRDVYWHAGWWYLAVDLVLGFGPEGGWM